MLFESEVSLSNTTTEVRSAVDGYYVAETVSSNFTRTDAILCMLTNFYL